MKTLSIVVIVMLVGICFTGCANNVLGIDHKMSPGATVNINVHTNPDHAGINVTVDGEPVELVTLKPSMEHDRSGHENLFGTW